MQNASRAYKKKIHKSLREYKSDLSKKIRNLKSPHPKEYWNLLNGHTRSHNSEKPDLDTLKEHFRKLNTQPEDEFNVGMSSIYYSPNPILYQNFTEEEIKRAIKHLKNNKSCGIDEILNEYLISSTCEYIKLYTKLYSWRMVHWYN